MAPDVAASRGHFCYWSIFISRKPRTLQSLSAFSSDKALPCTNLLSVGAPTPDNCEMRYRVKPLSSIAWRIVSVIVGSGFFFDLLIDELG